MAPRRPLIAVRDGEPSDVRLCRSPRLTSSPGPSGAALSFALDTKRAVTVAFLILAGAQLGHVFNMVSPRSGFVFNEVTRNPWIWGAIILCVGLLIAAVYVPILSEVLGTEEPGKEGWLLVFTLSFAPVLVGQSLRTVGQIRRKYGRQAWAQRGGSG